MNTSNYETLLLAKPEITQDELSTIERTFEKILEGKKGKLAVFDRWGKYLLAYPVAKNSYGVYALARYKVPSVDLGDLQKELDTYLKIKCNDLVLRYVTVKLEGDAESAYPRPEAVDNTKSSLDPAKKSKIENLLDSVDSSAKAPAAAAEESKQATEEQAAAPATEPVAEAPVTEEPAADKQEAVTEDNTKTEE